MSIEVDIKEMKGLLKELNEKVDLILESKETVSIMRLAERSLKDFLEKEPDVYSLRDVKVRYR